MDEALNLLPLELKEKICEIVHKMNMAPILRIIQEQIVWVQHENQIMFMVSESKNYYADLALDSV